MTPLRQIKRNARRDLHSHMQIPAVYLTSRSVTPGVLVHVRLHNKFDTMGDVKGSRTYPSEMENITPQLVFDLSEISPGVGAIVSLQAGEAYQVDHVIPNDDAFQNVYVTRLLPDRAANLPVPSDDGLSIVLPGNAG